MVLDDEFVGRRIRDIREINNMTQSKFSERMHLTQQTLSRYETGKTPIPYETLADISSEFSIPISYFFGIDTEEISEEEFLLVEYYRKVDDRLKERVLDIVKTIAKEFHTVEST